MDAQSLVFPPYKHSYGIRKATPKHLFMFFGPRTSFRDPQGLATAKMKSRDKPDTEGDDDEVVVYGVNAGRHQIIYNTSMWGLSLYGEEGHGQDQFFHPRGIACDVDGNVFVADSGNRRVVHLYNPLKEVVWVGALTGGPGAQALKSALQVALDEDGLVYVTDPVAARVVVLNKSNKVVRTIAPSSGFENGPTAIAVADGRHRWSYFRSEQVVFCADRNGTRLWKYDLKGTVLRTAALPPGHHASYAAIDYYHNLWVTVRDKHCVLKYDHNLKLVDTFGSYGKDDNQFVEPRGIAIWKRYGQTFIAEKNGAQYYWMGTECTSRKLEPVDGDRYRLSVTAPEYSFVTVMGLSGQDTVRYVRHHLAYPGGASLVFGGRADKPVAACDKLILRLEPTYSSYTYNQWDYPLTVPGK